MIPNFAEVYSMRTVRKVVNRRVLVLLGVLAMVATTLVLPAPRMAEAALQGYDCDYYSSEGHTSIVGWKNRLCNGTTNSWGTVTAYPSCLYNNCGGGGGGGN